MAVPACSPVGLQPARYRPDVPHPPVVALVGIDGAGKTTQARLLARALAEDGVPASYFENGGGRPVLDRLARAAGRRDGPDLLGPAYVVLEAAIRWAAVARALLLSRLTGRVAVLDRSPSCQYALMRTRGDAGERWARAAFGLLPAPDLVVLLTVPAPLAQERVERRGRDREDVAYLAAFDRAYRSLPEAASFRVVDGSGTTEQVQVELRRLVIAARLPG